MGLKGCVAAMLLVLNGLADTPDPGAGASIASGAAPAEGTTSGPQALKQQVQIVVDTNAPPSVSGTNAVPAKDRYFKWEFDWQGWDGLYVKVSERKLLNWPEPKLFGAADRTNALKWVHLEESKMEGHIGARIALDGAAFANRGDLNDFNGGVELRRLRLYAKGDCIILLPVSYELEIGYVPGGFYIEDSYLAFENLGVLGEFKFGQFQPPMSLEALTSSRDITFMEDASPVLALAPGVNAGFQFSDSIFKQRATWALGLFAEGLGDDTGDASSNYARMIGRFTCLPWYQIEADDPSTQHLLHLGFSGNVLYSTSSDVRYQSRPECHIAPIVIDTGDIDADRAAVVDLEAAWVKGPLSIQGEFLNSFVDETGDASLHFHGFYGYVSYFLTGESRPYDRRRGYFTRLYPRRDFSFKGGGWGAWEISGRVSHTDLNDGNISGGRMTLFAGGVTWYPNAHLRWKFNYIHGQVSGRDPSGSMNIFETRMEVDF